MSDSAAGRGRRGSLFTWIWSVRLRGNAGTHDFESVTSNSPVALTAATKPAAAMILLKCILVDEDDWLSERDAVEDALLVKQISGGL